jgi:hypothetical protein
MLFLDLVVQNCEVGRVYIAGPAATPVTGAPERWCADGTGT